MQMVMRRLALLGSLLAALAVVATANSAQSIAADAQCGLDQPAFCDTFSQPQGTGNRSGQLNGIVWGVSRTTGHTNVSANLIDAWSPTQVQACSGPMGAQPENDIVVCNGQIREATTDNGTVTSLTMYPKQPFDFAGRTGVVTFDVSNDTQGSHAAWPEFWITDKPVPAPFTHFASWMSAPQDGFGVRFYASAPAGKGALLAPNCPNDGNPRWTVGSAVVIRNYTVDDQDNGGGIHATPLDCVIASSGPDGGLNHVQLSITQSQIDVYATDAGTVAPLKHIGVIQNANLTLTRGLIWLVDAHYAAGKFNSHETHTFAWANVGFDGPLLSRDLTFDVPDNLQTNSDGTLNLGWKTGPDSPAALTVPGVTNIESAAAVFLTFNLNALHTPVDFTYAVNGNPHTLKWPYPDAAGLSWRTLALPVPLTDVTDGDNLVEISTSQPAGIANVDLILAAAGGAPTSYISLTRPRLLAAGAAGGEDSLALVGAEVC